MSEHTLMIFYMVWHGVPGRVDTEGGTPSIH